MSTFFHTTGWDCRCPRPRVGMGGPRRGSSRRDYRSPNLREWTARKQANPLSPNEVIGPEPASEEDEYPIPSPRRCSPPARGFRLDRRGCSFLETVRRGRPLAAVSPRSTFDWGLESPTPAAEGPTFPRGGTARRSRGGRGRGFPPPDEGSLRRPNSEAYCWGLDEPEEPRRVSFSPAK